MRKSGMGIAHLNVYKIRRANWVFFFFFFVFLLQSGETLFGSKRRSEFKRNSVSFHFIEQLRNTGVENRKQMFFKSTEVLKQINQTP